MPTSKKNKTPQQFSIERRDVLLEAATREFLERGLRGCSIDHISRTSGVSKTTIYRRYPSKEALFEAVALQIAEGFVDLDKIVLDVTQPEASLRALAEGIYFKQRENSYRELFRLLIAEAPHLPGLAQRVRTQMMERLLKALMTFFAELIAAGRIHHPNPMHAATTFYVLAAGSFRLLLNAHIDEAEDHDKHDADITLFLRGIGLVPCITDEAPEDSHAIAAS